MAAMLFCVYFAFTPSAAAQAPPAYGDLTGDGMIGAADAALMLRSLARGALWEKDRPDLDFTKNGEIDSTDARAALLYACGGIADMTLFGERVSSGLCNERIFDRFCYAGTLDDGKGNYRSENVCVTVSDGHTETSDYYLVDIYVQDIACIATAFSGGTYQGGAQTVKRMFDALPGAIVAINGDFYSRRLYGPVVRNGATHLSRVTGSLDIAVLLLSGELLTYPYGTLTKEALAQMDAYQTWVFGPALLDEEGHAKTKFRSWVLGENPRSVLGYYEPGHYAFLAVDGRNRSSDGLSMRDLSLLCEELGFTRAYNLDGGQSSVLLAKEGPINDPYRDGRPVSDIIAVCDLPQE